MLRAVRVGPEAAIGTHRVFAGSVRFQEVGRPIFTADMRRKADVHDYRKCPMKKAADNAGEGEALGLWIGSALTSERERYLLWRDFCQVAFPEGPADAPRVGGARNEECP